MPLDINKMKYRELIKLKDSIIETPFCFNESGCLEASDANGGLWGWSITMKPGYDKEDKYSFAEFDCYLSIGGGAYHITITGISFDRGQKGGNGISKYMNYAKDDFLEQLMNIDLSLY